MGTELIVIARDALSCASRPYAFDFSRSLVSCESKSPFRVNVCGKTFPLPRTTFVTVWKRGRNFSMVTDDGGLLIPVKTLCRPQSTIRPRSVRKFSIPYDDLVIRAWKHQDRLPCIELVSSVLMEYGLAWDPLIADRDVVDVENAYGEGEFWVIEDTKTSQVVGTGAFYGSPQRGAGAVEIRKMYLDRAVRGRGLGSFLLSALEQRAFQLGYSNAFIETASVLKEAHTMYTSKGYVSSKGLETERCDIVLEKQLVLAEPPENVTYLEAIDMTWGWTVARVTRNRATRHRLLSRAVVVLVENVDKVVVHKRAAEKSVYPGRMAPLITGEVNWMEDPLQSARREVEEELGISGLDFTQPFAPFIAKGADSLGQRILFHPFVAKGAFGENDIVIDPKEVEATTFMSRQEINEAGIGGSLWEEFRGHGL